MSRIITKLNLNKTPQLVDSNSLICAKNIRVLKDGNIGPDTPVTNINILNNAKTSIESDLRSEKADISNEINTVTQELEDIGVIIQDYTTEKVYRDYVNNNPFIFSEGDVSLDDLANSENDWYVAFESGDGRDINHPIIEHIIEDSSGLLAALKEYNNSESNSFLFPISDFTLYGNVIYNLCNNDLARDAMLQSSKFAKDTDYINKIYRLKDTDNEYFKQHFFELVPVTKNNQGRYVIDYYHLIYVTYFLFFHADAIINEVEEYNRNKSEETYNYGIKEKNLKERLYNLTYKEDEVNQYINIINNFDTDNYTIAGIIPYNTCFYVLYYDKTNSNSLILKYDENTNTSSLCKCNWNWSGGTINGICTVNLRGETILTICEDSSDKLIPIKTINLNKSSLLDNESIYTQTPEIPLFNLNLSGYYPAKVSYGVYQFFIRYEISDDTYTSWFPVSKPVYTAKQYNKFIQQGWLKYADLDTDSDKGFIFDVDKLYYTASHKYKRFQIAFIHSSRDGVVARSWKHFDMNTSIIYFDRSPEYIEEIDITDLLYVNYGVYNVKNITAFKNKLYISNYTETDFNPVELSDYTDYVNIELAHVTDTKINAIRDHIDNTIFYAITIQKTNNALYISKVDSNTIFQLVNGLFIDTEDNLDDSNYTAENNYTYTTVYDYGLRMNIKRDAIESDYHGFDGHSDKEYVVELWHNYLGEKNVQQTARNFISWFARNNKLHEDALSNIVDSTRNFVRYVHDYTADDWSVETLITDVSFTRVKIYSIIIRTRYYKYTLTFDIDDANVFIASNSNSSETLIPYQTYSFYIHFVKTTGEYTNGFKIGDDIYIDNIEEYESGTGDAKELIYPKFKFKKALPTGYIACFITMKRVKGNTIQLFSIDSPNNSDWYGNAIELDTLLEGELDDIKIEGITENNNLFTAKGKYLPSYDTSNLDTFGASGKVHITGANHTGSGDYTNFNRFLLLDYNSDTTNIQIERLTPYIIPKDITPNSFYVYDNISELNLQGFICKVIKPVKNEYTYYVSGNDWYSKTKQTSDNKTYIKLEELDTINNITPDQSEKTYHTIYSNYNLDFISITKELYPQVKTSKVNNNNVKELVYSIDSMLLSSIYELKPLFYNYTKKYYLTYDKENNYVVFDNTIRSSSIIGDEETANIYKFNSSYYYNVPTDKGKITNLKAIGNAILVHTEDSLFKFSGSNTFSTNGGEEVVLSEQQDIFDTGIVPVFGSEYGFGGLKSRNHFAISENNYSFYDSDSKTLYLYKGQGELKVISDDIKKIIEYGNIKDIRFASDYYNDRIFIKLILNDDSNLLLSYNFKVSSFISIHDFIFDYSFNTKTNCYFVYSNQIYKKERNYNVSGDFTSLLYYNDVYPSFKTLNASKPYIDIIINENYEIIKTLNFINWICSKIESFYNTYNIDSSADEKLKYTNVAEEKLDLCLPYSIQIYTNTTSTKNMLIGNYQDIDSIDTENRVLYENIVSANKPYANLGRWNFNYFRNSLNTNGKTNSDNMSLIYGHYFVVRFVFDNNINFKFEDLNINYGKEYETAM